MRDETTYRIDKSQRGRGANEKRSADERFSELLAFQYVFSILVTLKIEAGLARRNLQPKHYGHSFRDTYFVH